MGLPLENVRVVEVRAGSTFAVLEFASAEAAAVFLMAMVPVTTASWNSKTNGALVQSDLCAGDARTRWIFAAGAIGSPFTTGTITSRCRCTSC